MKQQVNLRQQNQHRKIKATIKRQVRKLIRTDKKIHRIDRNIYTQLIQKKIQSKLPTFRMNKNWKKSITQAITRRHGQSFKDASTKKKCKRNNFYNYYGLVLPEEVKTQFIQQKDKLINQQIKCQQDLEQIMIDEGLEEIQGQKMSKNSKFIEDVYEFATIAFNKVNQSANCILLSLPTLHKDLKFLKDKKIRKSLLKYLMPNKTAVQKNFFINLLDHFLLVRSNNQTTWNEIEEDTQMTWYYSSLLWASSMINLPKQYIIILKTKIKQLLEGIQP